MVDNLVSGDVVQLKSGGPKMTVKWVQEGEAYCEWFDNKETKGHAFDPRQLEKV